MKKRWWNGRSPFLTVICVILASSLCACGASSAARSEVDLTDKVFSDVDYRSSPYKHLNNGGISGDSSMPYNIDAITGATVTVEGPGLVASIPLSMRELENREAGLFRGIYRDDAGQFVYEGLDLRYLLRDMVQGDSGIVLTDKAYRVELKNSNRETIATFRLDEVDRASREGRPILLAYGMGDTREESIAPFVYPAANENERSAGYVEELDNEDGCLRLVYDLKRYGENADYTDFSNVAYVYVREEKEPGFKHTGAGDKAYGSSRYLDYIITFRGKALGNELNFTVKQLEELVAYQQDGGLMDGGMGYRDSYSLANNTYWYVNEYEGLVLYNLLMYLGMDSAPAMGLAQARTTLVSFVANDGVTLQESFSVDTLSYPDAFGFYNKNAADSGDGSYKPTNADLVDLGYPILLAYGVNHYPYTITKTDDGYLSGLSNSGGPMRVVFGKTQYSHANGSHQVQYLKEIIAGEDVLYNTHQYTDVPACHGLAEDGLTLTVKGQDGVTLLDSVLTVGELEDVIYGKNVGKAVKKAASVKGFYQARVNGDYGSDIYEGVDLAYLLLETLKLPGTNGTATLQSDTREVTVNLDRLFRSGYHTQLGVDGLSPILAFAKNGAPMVPHKESSGYVEKIALNPMLGYEPAGYRVQNSGGPLAVLIPSTDPTHCDALDIMNVKSIKIDLVPDAYAHLSAPYDRYRADSVRFFGEGLERETVFSLADLESRQTRTKTLDYSFLSPAGKRWEQRYRGLSVYELFTEIGIKSNAGDVTVYTSDGTSATFPLSQMKKTTYLNDAAPGKPELFAMLAYGAGQVGADSMQGLPLVDLEGDAGYSPEYQNEGGPLRLIMPQADKDDANAVRGLKNVVAIEVGANEIDSWGHGMSDVYNEFLDYPFTFTVKNDDSEWSHVFTLAQLETLSDLTVRERYTVLDIGECEGIHIWKFIQRFGGKIPGIDDPIAVNVYASDGYKNDLLSVFYKDGLELGVPDGNGDRKPLILAYAIQGLPLVDSESHEGYTGLAGNTAGPLRVIAETNQGASVKYASKLVVTIPGSGPIENSVDESIFQIAK